MIPKIIHYCWLSDEPIPNKLQECMATWKEKLPDYQFILWDFNRFDIHSSVWVKQAFTAKKYAFAADYIRLYAVYHYGGIYMDMDVEVVKSFPEDLLKGDSLLGYESNDFNIGIEAGIFGGEQGSEWLEDCLKYYDKRSFIMPDGCFDTLPLPRILLKVLGEKYIHKGKIHPLTPDFLTAKSYDSGKIRRTQNTCTIHHFEGSWFTPVQKVKKMLIQLLGNEIMSVVRKFRKRSK